MDVLVGVDVLQHVQLEEEGEWVSSEPHVTEADVTRLVLTHYSAGELEHSFLREELLCFLHD